MAKNDEELIPTRATLLDRMKDWKDQSSWQEFFDTYWKLIYGVARKGGLSDAEAQDVVQETMVSVAKQMPQFKYDPAIGSFKAWLFKLTRWRIVDQLRKRGPIARHHESSGETARTATIEGFADEKSADFDAIWEADWAKTVLDAAMTRVKGRLDPQKFQIFDFYVNREWPPEKVAQTFNVSINQVYIAKNRVTEMLRDEVQRLEREAL
ncbi:MAG TPA: sigma-70 family RNA polymerase sigma factor [Verrucomicrobiae bacterium]|nr:sigma-70 family RNA polymerase sigma factor [Verrucomicrobiae bacterium]